MAFALVLRFKTNKALKKTPCNRQHAHLVAQLHEFSANTKTGYIALVLHSCAL